MLSCAKHGPELDFEHQKSPMKLCPDCGRRYPDETLNYCLDDGAGLVYGATEENPTLIAGPPSRELDQETAILPSVTSANLSSTRIDRLIGNKWLLVIAGAVALVLVLVAGVWYWRPTTASTQPEIKSLAVLPLKSLDSGDNYLGLGIADAVIRRISQTGEVAVRPTSAVRPYLTQETDALTAAKQLNADAVLEGTVQRANERLRVGVNLLRASDGVSLWSDSFDLAMTDVFAMQDTVSREIAARLRLRLDPSQNARLAKQYTANPVAYEFYLKGIYNADTTGDKTKEQTMATIDLYKKAIEADPNFALAHAQLAYAYAEMATFVDPTDAVWADHEKEEVDIAQRLDPQLAEIHLARSLMLWSGYGGFQIEAAIRELLLAQQSNPSVGHGDLADLYAHCGLEDLAARELQHASEIDPTSESLRGEHPLLYWLAGRYDEWFDEYRKQFGRDPDEDGFLIWYLMGKGRLDDAQKTFEEIARRTPDEPYLVRQKAMLDARLGKFSEAESEIQAALRATPIQNPNYHHVTYYVASIYAMQGKSSDAVIWLRKTAQTGFPNYTLFERDHNLDRIREAPEFIQFLADMKSLNDKYKSEFSSGL